MSETVRPVANSLKECLKLEKTTGVQYWVPFVAPDGSSELRPASPDVKSPLSQRKADADIDGWLKNAIEGARLNTKEAVIVVLKEHGLFELASRCDRTAINQKLFEIISTMPIAVAQGMRGFVGALESAQVSLKMAGALLQLGARLTPAQLKNLDSYPTLRQWIEQEMAAYETSVQPRH